MGCKTYGRHTLEPLAAQTRSDKSLQLCVFGFGLLEEGQIGVGVLPEIQEGGQRVASLLFLTPRRVVGSERNVRGQPILLGLPGNSSSPWGRLEFFIAGDGLVGLAGLLVGMGQRFRAHGANSGTGLRFQSQKALDRSVRV